MIIVLLAEGFEEIEALTPVDMLRRAALTVNTVGITGRTVAGAHGISVACDLLPDEVDLSLVDMVILPGGMPGTLNLFDSPFTEKAVRGVLKNGGRVAAICAAPLILGRYGLLNGGIATCYPGFENELRGAILVDRDVVTFDSITTARGMGVAVEFSLELIRLLCDESTAAKISNAICRRDDNFLIFDDTVFDEIASFNDDPLPDELGEEPTEADEACRTESDYTMPSVELLTKSEPSGDVYVDDDREETILAMLSSYRINAEITGKDCGASVTRFYLLVDRTSSINRILKIKNELSLALGCEPIRIIAPIPGRKEIGIEVPNKHREMVRLRDIAESEEFMSSSSVTTACLGKELNGNPVVENIAKFPHLLVAGATGMGKSVAINSILASLLMKADPGELKLMLIDPKQIEFTDYKDIPHLITPIINDPFTAAAALDWAVSEMERRYSILRPLGIRSIAGYNGNVSDEEKLPYIVIVIDELADLIVSARESIERALVQLAQKARAAGIFLIVGTQRPSRDIISGVIKANIPSRLCCKVASRSHSLNVLDCVGAENLINNGDALFAPCGAPVPKRIQIAYISPSEIRDITDSVRRNGDPEYDDDINKHIQRYFFRRDNPTIFDDRFLEAVDIAVKYKKISSALIQRSLTVGYCRAARYLEQMERLGIVTPLNENRQREVLFSDEEWQEMLKEIEKIKKAR